MQLLVKLRVDDRLGMGDALDDVLVDSVLLHLKNEVFPVSTHALHELATIERRLFHFE